MACTPLPGGGFSCSRGSSEPRCSVVGCSAVAAKFCDHRLTGRAAGRTCSRALCVAHATSPQGLNDSIDLCPAHARMAEVK